jgi:hypothetical protein
MLTSALPNVERIAKQLGARDWVTKPYRVQLLPQKLRLLTANGAPDGANPNRDASR